MKKYIWGLFLICTSLFSGSIEVAPNKYYAGGFHYIVHAHIKGNIDEARVYFKDNRSKKYRVYAKMNCVQEECRATLPISSPKLKVLEYFIIYKTRDNILYASATRRSIKRDMLELPVWQRIGQDKQSPLYTEYAAAPKNLRGFYKNLNIDTIDPLDIFGVQFGLYSFADLHPVDKFLDSDVCAKCKVLQLDEI